MSRTALVTGALGQDGSFLCELLLGKGYRVVGWGVETPPPALPWDLPGADFAYRRLDLRDAEAVERGIAELAPDEVYNLAALSHVGRSFERPRDVLAVNGDAVVVLLEALRRHRPEARFFGAASAEVFGSRSGSADELTPMDPVSPYGASKAYALQMTRIYRHAFGIHASAGIFFNHESERRPESFVTRKITRAMARIARGTQERLTLGNVAARRDWGYAPDYVEAAWRMLQADEASDYVVATGEGRRVADFVDAAARAAGLELSWEGEGLDTVARDAAGAGRGVGDPKLFRPIHVEVLVGDAGKARSALDWRPRVGFDALVARMVEHDLTLESAG
ncbi:MAG: GDP-mannose 4,6-dehydratase [Myxococcota bacterium]